MGRAEAPRPSPCRPQRTCFVAWPLDDSQRHRDQHGARHGRGLVEGAYPRDLSQHRRMGRRDLRDRSGGATLFPQERKSAQSPRGGAAGHRAAQSDFAQPRASHADAAAARRRSRSQGPEGPIYSIACTGSAASPLQQRGDRTERRIPSASSLAGRRRALSSLKRNGLRANSPWRCCARSSC